MADVIIEICRLETCGSQLCFTEWAYMLQQPYLIVVRHNFTGFADNELQVSGCTMWLTSLPVLDQSGQMWMEIATWLVCGGVKPWGSCFHSNVWKHCDTLQSAQRLGVCSEQFPFYHGVQRTPSAQGVFATPLGDAGVRGPVNNISNFETTTGPGQKTHHRVRLFHLCFTAWRSTEMFPDIICRPLFYPILEWAFNKTLPG